MENNYCYIFILLWNKLFPPKKNPFCVIASPFSMFFYRRSKHFLKCGFQDNLNMRNQKKSGTVLSLKLKLRQIPETASYQEVNGDLLQAGGEASVHRATSVKLSRGAQQASAPGSSPKQAGSDTYQDMLSTEQNKNFQFALLHFEQEHTLAAFLTRPSSSASAQPH